MSRKEHRPAAPGFDIDNTPPGHALALSEEAETKAIESEMALTAMRALGRMEGLEFSATVADRARVEIYLELKQNKAYRALTVKDADGKPRRVADLEEFCELYLKKSARRIQELASHYHVLGSDLYEVSERLGFRNQDYRAFKALPADDQDVIKQAMQAEDSGKVIDLIQEMAVRHASEKAELKAKAQEAEDTAEARSEVIAAKETKINALEESNHKLKRRVETATPDEVAIEIRKEADLFAFRAEHAIGHELRKAFEALTEQGGNHSEFMLGLITQIELAASVLRADFGLLKAGPDGDPTPYWERDQQPAVN